MFIVGHSRRFPRREVFPIAGTSGQTIKQVRNIVDTVGGDGLEPKIMQLVGDRDKPSLSIKDHAFTIPANPMSDRGQMVVQPVLTPDREEKRQNGRRFKEPGEPMFTLTAQDRHGVLIKHKPEVRAVALQNANMQGRRIKEEGEPSFTISATDRHGVLVSQRTGIKEVEVGCTLDANYYKGLGSNQERTGVMTRHTKDGFHLARNDEKKSSIQGTHVTYPEGRSHCLGTSHIPMTTEGVRIRRLTPLECFRLQGFPDEHFHNAKAAGVSDSQLYKQAGNAVTVNVVYEIAKRLG